MNRFGGSTATRSACAADGLLQPFFDARDEGDARRRLEGVLQSVEPIIQGIVRRRWRSTASGRHGQSASGDGSIFDDIRGEVILRILAWLALRKAQPDPRSITNFRGFVAVTTYHVCDNHLRQMHPRRAALKDKLRYLLSGRTAAQGFAVWETANGARFCGFAAWRERERPLVRTSRYQQLLDRPLTVASQVVPGQRLADLPPADQLAVLFHWLGDPIELDDLVTIVAELWGVRDEPEYSIDAQEEREALTERVADSRVHVATEVEQRAYLQRLWTEIRQLPPRQCTALLLNLRDSEGRGVLALLPLQGVATLREIAAAMAMPAEQFALLWNDLPIEDTVIAAHLDVTRQQVINLRKAARDRLARRMKLYEDDFFSLPR
jgi:hypothetical protein